MRSRPEVEWDEQQQAHMLALGQWRAMQCPGCKGHLPDTTAEDADGAYVVPQPTHCHACEALDIAAAQLREEPHPSALLLKAKRREVNRG